MDDGLGKAKGRSKNWDQEAKEGTETIASAEKERDKAKAKAQVARLSTVAASNAKARVEEELARV